MKLYGKLNLQLNNNLKLIKYYFFKSLVMFAKTQVSFKKQFYNNKATNKKKTYIYIYINSVAINVEMTKVNILGHLN